MKANLSISILALVISTASLIDSRRARTAVDQEQIQRAASEALRLREKEFVRNFKPKFLELFADMGDQPKEWNPETIDELIAPIAKIIEEMGAQ
jgi:hypothetical protein